MARMTAAPYTTILYTLLYIYRGQRGKYKTLMKGAKEDRPKR